MSNNVLLLRPVHPKIDLLNQYSWDEQIKMPYLLFESLNVFTVNINISTGCPSGTRYFQYSYDNDNWTSKNLSSGVGTTLPAAQKSGRTYKLYLRCTTTVSYATSSQSTYITFPTGENIYCYGNIMSLIDYTTLPTTTSLTYLFKNLFTNNTKLVTAPALTLTNCPTYCYMNMFIGCTSLKKSPLISGTTLGAQCCRGMFRGCTSLTETSNLSSITTIAASALYQMYYGCSNIQKISFIGDNTAQLTGASTCCYQMFNGTKVGNTTIVKTDVTNEDDYVTYYIPTTGVQYMFGTIPTTATGNKFYYIPKANILPELLT